MYPVLQLLSNWKWKKKIYSAETIDQLDRAGIQEERRTFNSKHWQFGERTVEMISV